MDESLVLFLDSNPPGSLVSLGVYGAACSRCLMLAWECSVSSCPDRWTVVVLTSFDLLHRSASIPRHAAWK